MFPAILVWTPINYHDLQGEPESLQNYVGQLPSPLLGASSDPRGILLFPDGGEPTRTWPIAATYEQLVAQVTSSARSLFCWIQPPDVGQAPSAKNSIPRGIDSILVSLADDVLVELLAAKAQRDFDEVQRVARANLNTHQYATLEPLMRQWMEAERGE